TRPHRRDAGYRPRGGGGVGDAAPHAVPTPARAGRAASGLVDRDRDLALDVRREVAAVLRLQFGDPPVAAGDQPTARPGFARAHELVVVVRVGHGVVEAQFLAGLDVAHGNDHRRPEHPAVRLARVVDAV